MSAHAFYLAPQKWAKETFLDKDAAAHARVLRLSAGSEILVFDGEGAVANCRITHMCKKSVQIEILAVESFPEPRSKAIMAVALGKAVRRSFFMEKAAELGAWEIWLWQAERSQGKLVPALVESCRGQLIAGLEQSQNPWLPKLAAAPDISGIAALAANADWRILPWERQSGIPMLNENNFGREGKTVYVIGPEGGFSDGEIACLKDAGFYAGSLGGRVLRCETAATLCLGLHWWASQLPGHPDSHQQGTLEE